MTVLWNFFKFELGKITLDEKTLPFVGSAGKPRCARHYVIATFSQEPNSSPDAFDAYLFHTQIR